MRNKKVVNEKKKKRNRDNSHLKNEPPCSEAKESEFSFFIFVKIDAFHNDQAKKARHYYTTKV